MAVEPAHDVRAMRFGRFDAEAQCTRHFLAALSFRQKLDNFPLSAGQTETAAIRRAIFWIFTEVSFENHLCNLWSEESLIAAQGVHGSDEIAPGIGFQQISTRARLEDLLDQRIRIVHR